jgi:hypothetical protein
VLIKSNGKKTITRAEPEDSDAAMQEMSKMRIANSVGFFGLRDKENGGVVPNKKYNTLW